MPKSDADTGAVGGHRKRRGRTQWMLTLGEKKNPLPHRRLGEPAPALRLAFQPSRRLYPETLHYIYTDYSISALPTDISVPAANIEASHEALTQVDSLGSALMQSVAGQDV